MVYNKLPTHWLPGCYHKTQLRAAWLLYLSSCGVSSSPARSHML